MNVREKLLNCTLYDEAIKSGKYKPALRQEPSSKEFEAFLSPRRTSADRSMFLFRLILKYGEVWSAFDEKGDFIKINPALGNGKAISVVPFWPRSAYVDFALKTNGNNYKLCVFSLKQWIDEILLGKLVESKEKIAQFWMPGQKCEIISPLRLAIEISNGWTFQVFEKFCHLNVAKSDEVVRSAINKFLSSNMDATPKGHLPE